MHGQNGPDGGVSGREWALQDPIRGPVHLDRVRGRRKLAAQLPPAAIQRGQSSRARLGHKRAARGVMQFDLAGKTWMKGGWVGVLAGSILSGSRLATFRAVEKIYGSCDS